MNIRCSETAATHSFLIQLFILCLQRPPALQFSVTSLHPLAHLFPIPSLASLYIYTGPQPLALCQIVYHAIAAVAFHLSLPLLHPVHFFPLFCFALFAWCCYLPVGDLHLPADFAPLQPALPFDYLNCLHSVFESYVWVQWFIDLWFMRDHSLNQVLWLIHKEWHLNRANVCPKCIVEKSMTLCIAL